MVNSLFATLQAAWLAAWVARSTLIHGTGEALFMLGMCIGWVMVGEAYDRRLARKATR